MEKPSIDLKSISGYDPIGKLDRELAEGKLLSHLESKGLFRESIEGRVLAIFQDRDTKLYSTSQIPYDSEYDAYEDRSDKLQIIGFFPLP
jgi:hypothetical protein